MTKGWLSPWALWDSENAEYRIQDDYEGSPATPRWTFPSVTGTVSLSVSSVTIAASEDHSAGITKQNFVYNDLGTLVDGQTYRAVYGRYNVASTTPSNPVAEVTGVEGVAGSKINDEAITWRGGYFRTYIDTDTEPTASMRTAVGCEISARASYSGGPEVTAEGPGTAFVGARIWMAPYFTDASIANVNNSHALWIINETPNTSGAKYITNAIKIDATTYGAKFIYCFNTDAGKYYQRLDGSVAGSGLVAGETVTTSGDDWLYIRVSDYRTLTSAQVYNAGFFRYDVRATTPGAPQCEVRGLEAVASTYVADGNLLSMFGALLRIYIQEGATASAKTGIGAEISARAGYSGGVDCQALAGTCFTGSRIYMAPYFTAGTLANINNFWGLWIYGEHATQRNADAAIFISDAGGGFTEGIRFGETMTPDATRTNATITIGSRTTEKDITMAAAADQNLDPVQINLNIIGAAPTNTSTLNGIYQKITHDTTDMANIRLKCADWNVLIGQDATDAYVYQGELDITGACTLSGEAICMSALVDLGADVTADRICALQAMISGSGTAGLVTGDAIVAYLVNAGTVITTDDICKIYNQSAATVIDGLEIENDGIMTIAIRINNDGTCTSGIVFEGAFTQGIDFADIVLAPDATRTNFAIGVGDRNDELDVTMTAANNQNFDPLQLNLNIIGANPTNASTVNGIYQLIRHDTIDMSFLRLKCADWNIIAGQDLQDAYVYQGELDFTGGAAITVGGEGAVLGLSLTTAASTPVTGNLWGAIIMTNFDAAVAVSSSLFLSHRAGTLTHFLYMEPLGGTTVTDAIYINPVGTITNFLTFAAVAAPLEVDATGPTWTHRLVVNIVGVGTRYIKVSSA